MSLIENCLYELEQSRSASESLPSSIQAHRFPQIRPSISRISHPHCIPHHPPHRVLTEDDNLLAEVANSARVAAKGDEWHLCLQSLDYRFWERGARQEVRGPRVGGTGDEEEASVSEKGWELGE